MNTKGANGQGRVVAIDGPAGSGKSTVARAVAARLGLEVLETGAMYRAVAVAVLDRRADPAAVVHDANRNDPAAIASAIVGSLDIEMGTGTVTVNGDDVTDRLRLPEVARTVSLVAAVPEVRADLVTRQRRWVAERGGAVVEGRDIGSVVFPDADLKVFLTASEDERSRRRGDEDPADVSRRDRLDSQRVVSPLVVADGAMVIDTTGRSVDEVVDEIVKQLA